VLLELAAANAAFAVIKETLQNGGEIMSAGRAVVDWFNAKNSLQEKVQDKPPDQRSDLEEFFALEELNRQQQELKELFIYQGRPGLWDDWLTFQVKARQDREAKAAAETKARLQKKKKRNELLQNILLGFWIFVLLMVVSGMIVGAIWISLKGKF
jgi:hypothetical protein